MSDHNHYKLELTTEALDDFTDIIQYTIEVWGEKQALLYKDKIDNGFQIIIANPEGNQGVVIKLADPLISGPLDLCRTTYMYHIGVFFFVY